MDAAMSEKQQGSAWKRRRRWVPLAAVALVLSGFFGVHLAAKMAVRRELNAIRARGLPTTCLELDTWYKHVPASENAALIFLNAGALRVDATGKKNPDDMRFRPNEPMSPQLVQAMEL